MVLVVKVVEGMRHKQRKTGGVGTPHTGSGGGAGYGTEHGGKGGSGLIIFRYK